MKHLTPIELVALDHVYNFAARELSRLEAVREKGLLTTQVFADEAVRYRVWLADSLCWTVERFRATQYHEALRGYIQAVDYQARLSMLAIARTPTDRANLTLGVFADIMLTLRNTLEGLLK